MKNVLSVCCALSAVAALLLVPQATATVSAAAGPRIDLKVLVVSDGQSPVGAIAGQLKSEGVPFDQVNLTSKNRPKLNTAFLQDTAGGVPHGRYQAVVLPNADPFGDPAEFAALTAYEKQFGVRQVDAYVYPNASVGLNPPSYTGTLDGVTATLSPTGLAGPFRYLKGTVGFEDAIRNGTKSVAQSYGYVASPLPDRPGSRFETLLTATPPGGTAPGTLAGVYTHDGRSELELSYAYNGAQWQFRTIGHGLVTWMTKGLHLGYARNYFEVHVDDVFLGDARWSVDSNCTAGDEGCSDPHIKTPAIRMTAADAVAVANWQRAHGFRFDMLFNGKGSVDAVGSSKSHSDPLLTAFIARKNEFRWVNHTYEHLFVGCIQDFTVKPWRCLTGPGGGVRYMGKAGVQGQVAKNIAWARRHGITIEADELVTGEHSGLRILPQQPADNPNLAPALTGTGIKWLGGDASRENYVRRVGSALTQPRYPLATFYNVATTGEEVAEYNWIYTSKADGGSGLCTAHPDVMTCIKPLDNKTGYLSYIVPTDVRIDLSHVLSNDPRSHYAHQSNLAEDRILYPLIDRILSTYRATFADNAPTVNLRMSAIGAELGRQDAWRADKSKVTAYLQGGRVTVVAPAGLAVPLTAPSGTVLVRGLHQSSFGSAYAGERSAYESGDFALIVPATT